MKFLESNKELTQPMVPSVGRRILISFLAAIISGVVCWWYLHHFQLGGGDFGWSYLAGHDLLAGRDPYRPTDPDAVLYPLPAALIAVLFSPLSIVLAGAVFFGLSSGLLAFGLTQKSYLPLLAFLAAPYWVSLNWAQWTPLIVASAFLPVLGAVLVIKPHIAAPVVLTHLSRIALISIAVAVLISIAVYPTWPIRWVKQLGAFQPYFPLLTIPGPLLLLALLRRNDPDARFLLLASIFPQRWLYDAFILWLIPKTRKEFLYTATASWVGLVWRVFHMPQNSRELGLLCVLCFYVPMLLVILRRPKQQSLALGPLIYDEADLAKQLGRLSVTLRPAFAAACAQRVAQASSTYAVRSNKEGDSEALNQIFAAFWNDLNGHPMSDSELEGQIEASRALIPEDEDEWILEQGAAEDAAAALTYALRCRRNGSVQEAIWAARRTYDALDQFIINHENIDTNVRGGEERVLNHPLMQAELSRQARDLDDLHEGKITIEQLHQRSIAEGADFFGRA